MYYPAICTTRVSCYTRWRLSCLEASVVQQEVWWVDSAWQVPVLAARAAGGGGSADVIAARLRHVHVRT